MFNFEVEKTLEALSTHQKTLKDMCGQVGCMTFRLRYAFNYVFFHADSWKQSQLLLRSL